MNTVYLHPLIVHFPIALLIIGALASLMSKFFSKHRFGDNLRTFAGYSVIVGAAAAAAAVLSGYLFTKEMVGIMGELRNTHITFALITVTCAVVSAALMVVSLCPKNKENALVQNLATISSLITAAMVGLTGHYGGMMVFGA